MRAFRHSFIRSFVRSFIHPTQVVAFPPEGAVIADLGLRHHNISAWYRGLGQINRIQGVWEPDWVGIDFLVGHALL